MTGFPAATDSGSSSEIRWACFFDPAVANAITGFGQQMLHWTRDAFEAEGVAVLYGDTDSVFVQLRAEGEADGEASALRESVCLQARTDDDVFRA